MARALCRARHPARRAALGRLGRPRQPAGPGAAGAAEADRRLGAGARHRGRGARPHARRPGGDAGDAARPRLRGGRAERDAAAAEAEGILWLRPLLGTRRAELRAGWRRRRGLGRGPEQRRRPLRPGAGAGGAAGPRRARDRAERLAATARAMARARAALERATADLAGPASPTAARGTPARSPPFAAGAEELRLRLLSAALCWVSGAVYRPRLVRLEAALAAVEGGGVGHGLTLHGCVLRARGGRIAIRRELARMAAGGAAGRRALGRALADRGHAAGGRRPHDRRARGRRPGAARRHRAGPAREALAATPAIWRAGELVAAPVARPEAGVRLSAGVCRAAALGAGNSALNPPGQGLC